MTIKIYIGSATEITARLAGEPTATTTTVSAASETGSFSVASPSSFAADQSITIGKQRGIILSVVGSLITLKTALGFLPAVGDVVSHYDADYTKWRNQEKGFSFTDDLKTGGKTGSNQISRSIDLFDSDGTMPIVYPQSRVSIFDSNDAATCLFGGVILNAARSPATKASDDYLYRWQLEARGHAWEADAVGMEEEPVTNINSGKFLRYLMAKYTTLTEGEIDDTNSPTLDFVRLGNFKRFSEVGQQFASLWPEGEFFIQNDHSGGKVYFRQTSATNAPFSLDATLVDTLGDADDQGVQIERDYENVYNIIRFPFYQEQWRGPDFHVQTTTADASYLRNSVVLNGNPSSVEEATLLIDDFADGELDDNFLEYDLTNSSPPNGFSSSNGFLLEGELNGVAGLHLVTSGSAVLGDIGRVTDPAEIEPFTGVERQFVYLEEFAVNTLGDGVIFGVVDQTTRTSTVTSGATTTSIPVVDATYFVAGDRLDIGGQKAYVQSKASNTLTLTSALSGAPAAGVVVTLHDLAYSRIKFGVRATLAGDLKKIVNGVDSAFDTPRTYAATQSYSLRMYMKCTEGVLSGTPSTTTGTLVSPTGFATGDVVDVFSTGERTEPERRVITLSGSVMTYDTPLTNTPVAGYRVRTTPKIQLEIKGGAYGSVTGRTWTNIYSATTTWLASRTGADDGFGLALMWGKTLEATLPLMYMKNPIPVTAFVGGQYLHIGTQEVETSDANIDCILRKVGSHYQIDFFPDTNAYWSSSSTLELRYKERWLTHLDVKDVASMRSLAYQRGHEITDGLTESELTRLGGRVLDTLELLPQPLGVTEALTQARSILDAAKTPAYRVTILTNSYHHSLTRAGQILRSTFEDVPDLFVEQVLYDERYGVNNGGATLWDMKLLAGTRDRLSDILVKRLVRNGAKLVIDDGLNDDTYSRLQQIGALESFKLEETFTMQECASPDTLLTSDGVVFAQMICLSLA